MEEALVSFVEAVGLDNLNFYPTEIAPNFQFYFMQGMYHTWSEVKLVHTDREGVDTYCIFAYNVFSGIDTLNVLDEGTMLVSTLEHELMMIKLRGTG